jgi:hypothetical protein
MISNQGGKKPCTISTRTRPQNSRVRFVWRLRLVFMHARSVHRRTKWGPFQDAPTRLEAPFFALTGARVSRRSPPRTPVAASAAVHQWQPVPPAYHFFIRGIVRNVYLRIQCYHLELKHQTGPRREAAFCPYVLLYILLYTHTHCTHDAHTISLSFSFFSLFSLFSVTLSFFLSLF